MAHERIYREPRWNIECISSTKPKDKIIYLEALRTDAFKKLSMSGVPMVEIFTTTIKPDRSIDLKISNRVLKALEEEKCLSRLLDRAYNRIEILRLRINERLPLGNISYLRTLIVLSLEGLERGREELHRNTKQIK